MKVIATRHILYCSSQFAPGDEVTINDSEFIDLLKQHGSVKLEDKVGFYTEVDSDLKENTGDKSEKSAEDTVKKNASEPAQKFGRKSK